MLDAKSGKRIWVRDDDGQDAGIAFSPDGRLLAHVRGNVRLLDAATGDVVAKCESPRCFFTAAIFTRDGTAVIAVTTGDSPIVVFDAKKGTELHRLTLSPRAIPAPFGRAIASLSPDGKTLAIASRD